jgi:beta-phosphoglucomutase-like phosphatase (HAD superfamily)
MVKGDVFHGLKGGKATFSIVQRRQLSWLLAQQRRHFSWLQAASPFNRLLEELVEKARQQLSLCVSSNRAKSDISHGLNGGRL